VINQRVQEIVESIFGPLNQLTRNLLWGWIDPVDFVLKDGQSQGTFAVSQGQVGSVPANGAITFNGATGLLLWSGAPSGDYSLGLTGVGTTYRGALNFNNGTQSFFAPLQGELGLGRTLAAQIDFRTGTGPGTDIDIGAVAFALRAGSSSAGGLLGSTLSPAIRALASAGGEFGVGGVLRSLSQMASHVGRRGENPLGKLLEELLDLRRRVASSPMHQWLLPAVDRAGRSFGVAGDPAPDGSQSRLCAGAGSGTPTVSRRGAFGVAGAIGSGADAGFPERNVLCSASSSFVRKLGAWKSSLLALGFVVVVAVAGGGTGAASPRSSSSPWMYGAFAFSEIC